MREETRQRLEREIRRRRIKAAAAALAAAIIVVAIMAVMTLNQQRSASADPIVGEREVAGLIERWKAAPRSAGSPVLITLDVKLSDGRMVHAASSTHSGAQVGTEVRLIQRTHKSGRVDHLWP